MKFFDDITIKLQLGTMPIDPAMLELATVIVANASFEKLKRSGSNELEKLALEMNALLNKENTDQVVREFTDRQSKLIVKTYGEGTLNKLRYKIAKILSDFLDD